MKTYLLAALLFVSAGAIAAEPAIKFSFKNAEIQDVIEAYSKATGQKFIVDPSVRGKVSIFNQDKIDKDEAFAQLSSALAVNGLGISKQGEVMNVLSARNLQRNLIPVGTELPPLRPEQMFTWVINLKHANAERINREVRILPSKDGELVPVSGSNQIMISDWVSNLYRVQKIIAALDVPGANKNPPPPPPAAR